MDYSKAVVKAVEEVTNEIPRDQVTVTGLTISSDVVFEINVRRSEKEKGPPVFDVYLTFTLEAGDGEDENEEEDEGLSFEFDLVATLAHIPNLPYNVQTMAVMGENAIIENALVRTLQGLDLSYDETTDRIECVALFGVHGEHRFGLSMQPEKVGIYLKVTEEDMPEEEER